jgi:acyl-lipid omega-6 desaturase (Delta-12 desaturase)
MMLSEAPASIAARPFAQPSWRRALLQFGHTLLLYAVAMYLMFALLPISWFLTLPLALVAAAAYLRLFMIGHDCTHRSYLPTRWQNNALGNIIGVLTNTPLEYWGNQHAKHHRTTGNLDRRGAGDVTMLTVVEYQQAGRWARIWYRIYRNPFMLMFVFAPIYFIFMLRWPFEHERPTRAIWLSVLGTNLGVGIYYGVMIWAFGLVPFLLVYGPVVWLSSVGAVWLFYMQHQFDDTYWARDDAWSYHDATLYGSSFYDLPRLLHWASGNIGYHHIHHLNPRIPNYKLADCFASSPAVQNATHITFSQSLRLAMLALWDEDQKRLISFGEYRRRYL